MIFDGTWDISIETPFGNQGAVLQIATENGVLRGTAISPLETVDLLDPTADGNRLAWSQRVSKPMAMTVKVEVTVEGNAMSGSAKAGFFPPPSSPANAARRNRDS